MSTNNSTPQKKKPMLIILHPMLLLFFQMLLMEVVQVLPEPFHQHRKILVNTCLKTMNNLQKYKRIFQTVQKVVVPLQ